MMELPSSWNVASVGDISAPLKYGFTASADYEASGPRFLRITDIQDGRVDWQSVPRCEIEDEKLYDFRLASGDIVFARTGGTVGKSFLIRNVPEVAVFASYLIKVSPEQGIEPSYLYWFFQSLNYWEQISLKKGGLQGNVNAKTLASIEVALPPTNEQSRIVEKIEALFDEIDKGVEGLREAKAAFGLYRQSLLKHAFEGRLTADWRARNADKLEAPETLLARIQSERTARYKTALDDWQTALEDWREGGEQGKKPAKPKRPPQVATAGPITLASVVYDLSQGWSPKCKNEASVSDEVWGVIKTTAIQPSRFDPAENKKLPESLAPREHLELKKGDVLITRAGPRKRVGIACMVKDTRPKLILCDKAYRLQLEEKFVSPEFMEAFLNAPQTLDRLEHLKSGISDSGLNLKQDQFLSLEMWLPSIGEQAEIVRIIDARLDAANALEAEIDTALTRADHLRQSILKKAFSGKLVPQDPTDEPASALLERIQSERAASPRKRRKAHA